ncbi:MAG TPA: SDR family oxidoreductase [Gammaproteobacteria bacterium]|nr:SDR family oxidoreductase [Gammaproteobacteria bacterium]
MNVLITGTNRGIGLQMVKTAVSKQWRVFACCRNPHTAEKLAEVAQMSGGLVSMHTLDVADKAQIQALAYELRAESIDILLNNAGVYGAMNQEFGGIDEQDWLNTFRINTIVPMLIAEAFVENVARSERKIIASVSSKMGSIADNGSGGCYIYRSSKAALNAVMKSMSIDLAPRNIACVILHPGWVKTDMGGPYAEITTRESVQQMFHTLDKVTLDDSGSFYEIDGRLLPW